MADARQELTLERWHLGWNPQNQVPDYIYPRELRDGQVVEARNLRFTAGGRLEWRRNQFSVDAPTGTNVGPVKSVLEYATDDYNQLIAVVRYGASPPYSARFYYQNVTWAGVTPTQTTYGYELFNGGTWTQVTLNADAVALLDAEGIAGAVQAKNYLYLSHGQGTALTRWDGATLRIVGLEPPGIAPVASASAGGALSAGTYSYRYTYYDAVSGFESMPSPVVDVHITADESKVRVQGVTDYGLGYLKRIYRAYTVDTADDARGSEWYLLAELQAGTGAGSTQNLTTWNEQDTPAKLTVGANSLVATAMQEADVCYLDKDLGAGNEITGYDHRFTVKITSMDNGCYLMLMAAATDLGVRSAWTNGTGARLLRNGSQYEIHPWWNNYTAVPYYNTIKLATGTTYYCRLALTGTTLTLYVHLASDYSDSPQVESISQAGINFAARYMYALAAYGGAGTDACTVEVTGVSLDAATEHYDNVPAYGLSQLWEFDRATPPDGHLLAWHKDRMFMAGCTRGSTSYEGATVGNYSNVLFCSALDEPDYWPGDNEFVVGTDTDIVGLVSWGEYLVIFKENGVWTLTGYGDADFRLAQLTAAAGGVAAPGCYCAAPPGVLWLAPDGYYFWDGDTLERVLQVDEMVPWSLPASGDIVPRICYHGDRFYVMQDDGWLEYEPLAKRWSFHDADFEDTDADVVGLRAYDRGGAQSHVLTAMAWASAQAPLITVLDQAGPLAHYSAAGSSYSDYRAPVWVTLGPIEAAVGEELIPIAVYIDGSWTRDVSHPLYLFLTPTPEYSSAAGDNVWEVTPECPQGGDVIGVPGGYSYTSGPTTYYVTNAQRRWYVQIGGAAGADFELDGVRVLVLRRKARGA